MFLIPIEGAFRYGEALSQYVEETLFSFPSERRLTGEKLPNWVPLRPSFSAVYRLNFASSMTPEETAREQIDTQLQQCGWVIQNYKQVDLSGGRGIAIEKIDTAGRNHTYRQVALRVRSTTRYRPAVDARESRPVQADSLSRAISFPLS